MVFFSRKNGNVSILPELLRKFTELGNLSGKITIPEIYPRIIEKIYGTRKTFGTPNPEKLSSSEMEVGKISQFRVGPGKISDF